MQKTPSKAKNIILWVLQVLAALAFLGAGVGKLTAQPAMVEVFAQIGVGQWFRLVTGGIEVIGALLLLFPKFVPVGALLLAATMVGAVFTHLAIIGGSPVPPIVLLVLVSIIAWGRKDRLSDLRRTALA